MTAPADWSAHTLHANGVRFHYYRVGDGPPVVLLHGFSNDSRCWEPLVTELTDDYEVTLYDARGHGRSAAPDDGYAIEHRVSDLRAILTTLGIERPILIGHSMGATTIAATAVRYSALSRAVVLEEPAGMYGEPEAGPDERARIVTERIESVRTQSVEELMAEYPEREPALARRLAAGDAACRPQIAKIAREGYPKLEQIAPDIDCPTLVLKADTDPERRIIDRATAAELEHGRLVHVPDAGHNVFYDEFDTAYTELQAFLSQLEL